MGTVSPGAILRLVVIAIWVSLTAGFVEAQPAVDTTLLGPQVGELSAAVLGDRPVRPGRKR